MTSPAKLCSSTLGAHDRRWGLNFLWLKKNFVWPLKKSIYFCKEFYRPKITCTSTQLSSGYLCMVHVARVQLSNFVTSCSFSYQENFNVTLQDPEAVSAVCCEFLGCFTEWGLFTIRPCTYESELKWSRCMCMVVILLAWLIFCIYVITKTTWLKWPWVQVTAVSGLIEQVHG